MKKIQSFLVLLPMMVISQTQTENYIKTTTYKIATTTNIAAPTLSQASQNITYFDGLGRPIQQIASKQSANGKNIITPIEYDGFGRQSKDFLPYVNHGASGLDYETNALIDVMSYPSYVGQNPFSQKLLEASPLSRVMKQAAPGTDWALGAGHEIKLDYQTNTSATEVKLFAASTTWDAGLGLYNIALLNDAGTTYYGVNQLYKTITYDENSAVTLTEANGSTVEFKNKEGQVVLKRTYDTGAKHDTYYIYDSYGNLTYVVPPTAGEVAITTAILDDLCYQYKYDYRNRLVEKKLPGKQWEFIVYDKLDRPVATGPVFSPFSDSPTGTIGWLITKYDVFNRPVYTGWEQSAAVTSADRFSKQTTMNSLTAISEAKQATANTIDSVTAYYSNDVVPTSFKLLTINYYDDYNFQAFSPAISYADPVYYNNTIKPKGLSTGSWVRALTTLASISGESSYTLYDVKARPIKNFITNHLGGYTQIDSNLDAFSGRLNFTETRHKRLSGGAEIYVKEVFTYSAQERLLTHTHQIGSGGTPQLLASNTYDDLGQLIGKNIGNSTATPLQKIDYTYNIRGWLTEINKTSALQQGSDPKDLFAFKINYNTIGGSVSGVNPLYNGNISETYWRTASDNALRKYGYQYDNLNRLKNATYQKPENVNTVTNSYNENLTYDKNGNIISLLRNGDTDPISGVIGIDNLGYTYAPNTNRLINVLDGTNNTSGFNDVNKSGDDYVYDANGNMTIDKNKGIINGSADGITYNHLNLPIRIIFGTTGNIVYIYNALGQKLEKIVTEGTATNTNYLGGYQYTKPNAGVWALQNFSTAEGYVKNTGGVYSYVFNYTDHLGNVRLSYQDIDNNGTVVNSEILEESNYYPFGLKHKGYNDALPNTYKYKYNGKELQDELGLNLYDYGARNYDPALGRWINPDALSEEYSDYSPYVYAFNDPIRHVDPDGNAPEDRLGEIDPPGKKKLNQSTIATLNIEPRMQGGYVGQGLDEIVTAGIQWLGGQISGSDVSKETSENVQLATSLLVVVVSKGKNAKADGEVVEQLSKVEARAAKLSEKARPSEKFTKAGKEAVVDVNKAKNGGKTVCEGCKTSTTAATQSKKGVTPSKTETQVDHVVPKSKGGSGTPNNGQVLCRDCNIKKSNN
jgi:RHS repeat-associated protein